MGDRDALEAAQKYKLSISQHLIIRHLLSEIHNLKALRTKDDNLRFEEDEIKRLGRQEEVLNSVREYFCMLLEYISTYSVDSEPLRPLRPQTQS